jgi:hypothetical protein
MKDEYTGLAGTFIVDAVKGIRVPIEQYEAEQAAVMAIKDIAPEKIINPSEVN